MFWKFDYLEPSKVHAVYEKVRLERISRKKKTLSMQFKGSEETIDWWRNIEIKKFDTAIFYWIKNCFKNFKRSIIIFSVNNNHCSHKCDCSKKTSRRSQPSRGRRGPECDQMEKNKTVDSPEQALESSKLVAMMARPGQRKPPPLECDFQFSYFSLFYFLLLAY